MQTRQCINSGQRALGGPGQCVAQGYPGHRQAARRRCPLAQASPPEQGTTQTAEAPAKPKMGGFSIDPSTLEDRVRLRSEAEAPWRAVRFVFFGFSVVSAGVGLLVSIPQFIGAAGGAANALPLEEVLTNIGVDGGAAGLFSFLFYRDWKAREKQMARLGREESLSACRVQLSNGKKLSLARLRGNARVVVCAGTHEQVKAALEAAEPYKAELQRRGVLVIPLPIYDSQGAEAAVELITPPTAEELRWRVTPVQLENWKAWFAQQLELSSKATPERGLYISLRKDGRVRGSGMGQPPWERLALTLPPEEGIFKGFLDGMDGKV